MLGIPLFKNPITLFQNPQKRKTIIFISISFLMLTIFGCVEEIKEIPRPKTDLSAHGIIPKPRKVVPTYSAFALNEEVAIFTHQLDTDFEKVGQQLREFIKEQTKLDLGANGNNASEMPIKRVIYIEKNEDLPFKSPEGYELYIKRDSIVLNAMSAAGAFRGIQTLKQIFPQTKDTINGADYWFIPTGKITDEPVYPYRGAMLDVARHFFKVEEVKRYIDQLAYYKYNKLHLHLTDDQGWRIEIKAYPLLTSKGAQTEVGGGQGGFFTQEDYKDLVAYAQERYLEIIPEIDMPGHTNAASFAYGFLNGNGKPIINYTGTNVGFSTFDTQRDTVYHFIDKVFEEIADISPSSFIHMGGDESHVTKKKDYIQFVEKVEKIAKKHGKTLIGWEEISQAKLSPNSVVQFWRDSIVVQKAVEKGHRLIFSPAARMYLDMKYDSTTTYGLDWAGYISLKQAYDWQPETYVVGINQEHILGLEAPLWSETIYDSQTLEYLAFPRALAYAELAWSAPESRNWEDFIKRLSAQQVYFKNNRINYYPSAEVKWQ